MTHPERFRLDALLAGALMTAVGCSHGEPRQPSAAADAEQNLPDDEPAGGGGGAGQAAGNAGGPGVAGDGAGDAASAGGSGAPAPAGAAGQGETGLAGAGGDGEPGRAGAGGEELPEPAPGGHFRVEDLDRGLVAVEGSGGVYVGWRMLGYEYDAGDPERVAYQLLRDGEPIAVVRGSTNYLDTEGPSGARYSVGPIVEGQPLAVSAAVTAWTQNFVRIPLQAPPGGYSANDASAADLDGDGAYELVLKWEPDNARDNSQPGVTDPVVLDAIELDGTHLWRIDLGPNIRAGAHYTQFVAYDLDGDGGAELSVKTAPGTRAGDGKFLARGPAAFDDDTSVYRNQDGYVLEGPEYLSVFAGDDGRELATVAFDQARGRVSAWGDDYGNRVDRFLATAAYLDDTGLPSVVMARGYYTRTTLTAWNYRDGTLSQAWKFDSDLTPTDAGGQPYSGQGAHSLSVANVDDDVHQEIVYGAMTVDHDGDGVCSTGLGHGDALHVTDLIPSRPGLEAFMPHEYAAKPAWSLRDPATCEIIRQGPVTDDDVGRGVAADVVSGRPEAAEMWASGGVPFMNAATAAPAGASPSSINFVIWWDADESRELEDGTAITKYGGGTLLSCPSCASNNGTKATPTLSADLLGDWREEIIWRESDDSALRLYTTTELTDRRIYTLMHDPQYRVAISWQNVAYNQPPHPSFHIGTGMQPPPQPNIRVREPK